MLEFTLESVNATSRRCVVLTLLADVGCVGRVAHLLVVLVNLLLFRVLEYSSTDPKGSARLLLMPA